MADTKLNVFLYDGDCGFCNKSVNFLLDCSTEESMSFCAIQSDTASKIFKGQGTKANLKSSYLLKQGKLYADSSAVLHALSLCRYPAKLLSVFLIVPPVLRNLIYRLIAKNRHTVSRFLSDSCRIPTPDERKRFIA
jgi:predicted DCC family thiol-disulfide oxidoreductase YuxK